MGSDGRPTVLLVDDEEGLLELYEAWLAGACEVRTAAGGEAALATIDEAVDVAFLDRRMPDLTGEEVLREIRAREYDCQVAMLTAVEPEADVVELPFDDYLTKPVDGEDLKSQVDVLVQRSEYDERSQELFALASKKAALEASDDVDHEDSEEYRRLRERLEGVRAEVDATLDGLVEHDYAAAFREIEG